MKRLIVVESCKDCPFSKLIKSDAYYCIKEDKEYFYEGFGECFPEWCPLRHLPEKEAEFDGDPEWNNYARGRNSCIDEILR